MSETTRPQALLSLRPERFPYAVVDADLLPFLSRFAWYVPNVGGGRPFTIVSAKRGQPKKSVSLARFVASAAPGQWVMHRNHCCWDCRRENLLKVSSPAFARYDYGFRDIDIRGKAAPEAPALPQPPSNHPFTQT